MQTDSPLAPGPAASPLATHTDVTVQLEGGQAAAFRVRQITPFDYPACGDAYARMVGRLRDGVPISQMAIGCYGDALACALATAEPRDDAARAVGLRGVRCPASLRRVALAFIELNLGSPEALRDMGKLIKGFTDLLTKMAPEAPKDSDGGGSSTPSTSSSPTATPPSSPAESPSPRLAE